MSTQLEDLKSRVEKIESDEYLDAKRIYTYSKYLLTTFLTLFFVSNGIFYYFQYSNLEMTGKSIELFVRTAQNELDRLSKSSDLTRYEFLNADDTQSTSRYFNGYTWIDKKPSGNDNYVFIPKITIYLNISGNNQSNSELIGVKYKISSELFSALHANSTFVSAREQFESSTYSDTFLSSPSYFREDNPSRISLSISGPAQNCADALDTAKKMTNKTHFSNSITIRPIFRSHYQREYSDTSLDIKPILDIESNICTQ